jgi:hypothetical protein
MRSTYEILGRKLSASSTAKEIISHFDKDISTTKPHFISSKPDYSKITNLNFQGL